MRKLLFLLACCTFLARCGVVKKNTSYSEDRSVHVAGDPVGEVTESDAAETPGETAETSEETPADAVVETALTFTGVRYRYGGTTRKGMDCSGLLYTSFLENDIALPRTSEMLSEEGKKIKVDKVQKGDLLFFKTRRGRTKINHVGLVVDVQDEEVKFIHSTTSRGVIVSSLREGYWNHAFVKATRLF
ncbi:C40 family peptidase [Robiginitalea sp.]|jgi:cell wall-associated NlpC family hydrolase|uniref:C40 family peptidase n=1 Tax=Robiginitalea sp. TaxID=1902411 RepID=UPI003C734CF5